MPIFFIDTYVDQIHYPDRIGASFPGLNKATRTAYAALLDIVQDEDGLRNAVYAAVSVKEASGAEVFRACLTTLRTKSAERTQFRHRSKTSGILPLVSNEAEVADRAALPIEAPVLMRPRTRGLQSVRSQPPS